MVHYDHTRKLYVDVDTSKNYVRAMIYHVKEDLTGHIPRINIELIMFLLKALTLTKQKYDSTELEVAGLC